MIGQKESFADSVNAIDKGDQAMEKNLYVLTKDMENRTPEEIAKDITGQIAELFDKLIEKDQRSKLKQKNEEKNS